MNRYAEKDFQIKFTRWLRHKYVSGSAAFELKITHGGHALPFNAVKDHQIAALMAAKHGNLPFKIPDDSRGEKPFDCFILSSVDAYVVIQYYIRGCNEFIMIDVDDFVSERESSSFRKSLTQERAKQIGLVIRFEKRGRKEKSEYTPRL